MKRQRRSFANILTTALAAALSTILTVGAMCGCTADQGENIVFDSTGTDDGPMIPLTFFGYKYEALNVMAIEDALHGFMDVYPHISISYDGIKSPEYFEVLDKRLDTGNGDDIFMVDHEHVLNLGGSGRLADLSGISTLDDFSDLAKSQMTVDGTIHYLPTSISAFGLYCNLDLLKEHGQKVPENLTEFEDVCNYFVSRSITPIVANNDISLKTIVIAKSLLPCYQTQDTVSRLARFNSGETSLAEALRPGFELVQQMLDLGWVDRQEALATTKTKDDLVLFSSGKQPFMLTGAWAVTRLRELDPGFRFEVHPYPVMDDGCVLVINVDTRVSINGDSPHQKEAMEFVEYLTQSEVLWEFVDSQSSFSPLKENRLAEDAAIQPIGPYLTNGRSVIGSDDNLKFPIWDMSRQCIRTMLEGGSADLAVSHMEGLTEAWNNEKQGDDAS